MGNLISRLLVGVCILFSPALLAASFPCEGKLTEIEMQICDSDELSTLDTELSAVYKAVLSSYQDKTSLKNSQLKWLGARNACTTKSCIKNNYNLRIDELKQVAGKVEYEMSENFSAGYPLDFVSIYSKKRFCGEVFSSIKRAVGHNYERLTKAQKSVASLSYMTTQGEADLLSFDNAISKLWSSRETEYESPYGIRVRTDEFIYADINNDEVPEYIVKLKDYNDLSDGNGWRIYPRFDPNTAKILPLASAKKSVPFTYRNNNVDLGHGEYKVANNKNFHFNFVEIEGRVYVILMIHDGYSVVEREIFIVADLNESYEIGNQYCFSELTMDKQY